jgi:hypothetical protein
MSASKAKPMPASADPVSNRDFGSKLFQSTISRMALVKWFYDNNGKGALIKADNTIDFPEGSLDDIKSGICERYDANNDTTMYGRYGSGDFSAIGKSTAADIEKLQEVFKKSGEGVAEFKSIGAVVAYVGYTGQQFGKLRQTDKGLHSIIKHHRDLATDKVNREIKSLCADLITVHHAVMGIEPKKAERTAIPDFADRLNLSTKDTVAWKLDQYAISGKKRGDDTANPEWFRVCWNEFVEKYNKGPSKTKPA